MSTTSRRTFMKVSSATAASVALGAGRLAAKPLGLPIGLQLYSVREMLPKDLEGTLRQVAAAGYKEVEAAGYFGHPAVEIRHAMDQAGLRYDRASDTLTATEVRRLYRAIVETLADAIKHRGSSLADEQYRDLFGELGDFQGSHQVYDREGQPCRRCRNTIVRVKAGGRSTFFCEHCQV